MPDNHKLAFKGMKLSNSTCALCQHKSPLEKSHVIPASIFRRIFKTNNGKAISFSSDETSNIQSTSDSWWDYLLCKDCERLLNKEYESYSLALLRGEKGNHNKHGQGVTFTNVDLFKFHLFIISIFWRAAISQNSEYQKVYIPEPWQSAIRESLQNQLKIPVSRVSVKLSRLFDPAENGFSAEAIKQMIVSPFSRRSEDKYTFCFMFEGFFIEISTPGFKFSERNQKGIIHPNKSGFLAPYLSIFDIPELVDLLVAGYSKNLEGKTKIKS